MQEKIFLLITLPIKYIKFIIHNFYAKKLIFISLNELNFDLIKSYLHDPKLKTLKASLKKFTKLIVMKNIKI